jgi:hypothetical protein
MYKSGIGVSDAHVERKQAFLWTAGYVSRLAIYLGPETATPVAHLVSASRSQSGALIGMRVYRAQAVVVDRIEPRIWLERDPKFVRHRQSGSV